MLTANGVAFVLATQVPQLCHSFWADLRLPLDSKELGVWSGREVLRGRVRAGSKEDGAITGTSKSLLKHSFYQSTAAY